MAVFSLGCVVDDDDDDDDDGIFVFLLRKWENKDHSIKSIPETRGETWYYRAIDWPMVYTGDAKLLPYDVYHWPLYAQTRILQ